MPIRFQRANSLLSYSDYSSSTQEYNPELRGKNGVRVYNEMRRGDGQVGGILRDIKAPIMAASWFVECEDDPDFAEDANAMLGLSREGQPVTHGIEWDQFLEEMLTGVELGNALHEKQWDIRFNGDLWFAGAMFRPQSSIDDFVVDDDEKLMGVYQEPENLAGIFEQYSNDSRIFIPVENLIYVGVGREGTNFYGTSILRPAYKHWFIKDALYKMDAQALEKFGLGIAMADPIQMTEDGKPLIDVEEEKRASEITANMRSGIQANIVTNGVYKFYFLDLGANVRFSPYDAIAHHDDMIAKSVAAQFIQYGLNSSGNQSLVEQAIKLFYETLQRYCFYIVNAVNRYVLHPLLVWKYGPEVPQCSLSFSRLNNDSFLNSMKTLAELVDSEVIFADDDLDDHVRQLGGYPKRTYERQGDPTNRTPMRTRGPRAGIDIEPPPSMTE